jgi:hypothetical protein
VLQQQLKGKVDELSVDQEKVCQSTSQAVTGSKPIQAYRNDLGLLTLPVQAGVFTATIILLVAALVGCLWYGKRQDIITSEYSRVPLREADEEPKATEDAED